MSTDCIFCKIIARQAPAKIVYQDEHVTAFHDASPHTPVHLLIVPNRHIASVNEVGDGDEQLLGHLMTVARQLAAQEKVARSGYRLVINTGPDTGQSVFHLHMHLVGGRPIPLRLG